MTIRFELDVAYDSEGAIPTLQMLQRRHIAEMHVVVDGPGGGNPNLVFTMEDREDAVASAKAFLQEWYLDGNLAGVEEAWRRAVRNQ
jgi:hypothetical protein